MKIDNYKSLVYEEDESKANPSSFYNNGTGSKAIQHVTISNKEKVAEFLEKCGLTGIADEKIHLSILWNLPRKEYNEDESHLFVHMDGFTYGSKPPFNPKHFVIADYVVTEEAQEKAKELINMLNSWKEIVVINPYDGLEMKRRKA